MKPVAVLLLLSAAAVVAVSADCPCPRPSNFVSRRFIPKPAGYDLQGDIWNIMDKNYKTADDVFRGQLAKGAVRAIPVETFMKDQDDKCMFGSMTGAQFVIRGAQYRVNLHFRGYAHEDGVSTEICSCAVTSSDGGDEDVCGGFLKRNTDDRMDAVAAFFAQKFNN